MARLNRLAMMINIHIYLLFCQSVLFVYVLNGPPNKQEKSKRFFFLKWSKV